MRFILILIFMCSFTLSTASAFNASEYFQRRCQSCHTIGGGDGIGPDLKGVTDRRKEKWLIPFIKNSQQVINNGDPLGNKLFEEYNEKKMPAFDLTDAEVKQILDFIETGKSSQKQATFKLVKDPSQRAVRKGRELFTGQQPLEKGGTSCISCHSAGPGFLKLGGGSLGPDLALQSYPSYGDKTFARAIHSINFPTMKPVYKGKPITKRENYYIRAFLNKQSTVYTNNTKLVKKQIAPATKFTFFGVLAGAVLILLIDLVWRKRRKKTRRPY